MQRPAIFPLRDLLIHLLCLFQRQFPCDGDGASQLGIEAFEPIQIDPRQPLGVDLSRFDPARELRQGRVRDVFVFRGQGTGVSFASYEPVLLYHDIHV